MLTSLRCTVAAALLVGSIACAPAAKSPAPSEAPVTAAALPKAIPAVPTPAAALLVLSKRDRTLAIVDPSSLHVIAKVPVGEDPHEVIASADGKTAYVSNYGGGTLHTLAVVDLVRQKALPPIALGALRGPHGLVFVGGKLWFTAEGAKVVGRLDPATASVDWVVGTGQDRTHMIYVAPDMTWIAASKRGPAPTGWPGSRGSDPAAATDCPSPIGTHRQRFGRPRRAARARSGREEPLEPVRGWRPWLSRPQPHARDALGVQFTPSTTDLPSCGAEAHTKRFGRR